MTTTIDPITGTNTNQLHLVSPAGGVASVLPPSIATNTSITLPPTAGTKSQALTTDGNGFASWGSKLSTTLTLSSLKALDPALYDAVEMLGYYNSGDGGGGVFNSATGAPAGTYVDNGGSIIVPTGGDGSSAWLREDTGVTNVLWFGAKGDGGCVTAAVSITSGSNVLTVAGAGFTAADVGKKISVPNVGPVVAGIGTNGSLITTIAGFTSATQVTLAATASATLTAAVKTVVWGSDDTTAIQAAINASSNSIYFPTNSYLTTNVLTVLAGQTIYGDGYNSNICQITPDLPTLRAAGENTFRDLRLTLPNCTGAGYFGFLPAGVWVRNCNNIVIEDNFITGGDYGICGVYVLLAQNVTIKNNFIYGASWSGGPAITNVAADIYAAGVTRVVIDGNFCLSNNSQGINMGLGTEADFLITNNVCITLDPATCYPGGTWSEVANGGTRRTGILVSYSDDTVGGPRAVVDGNIVRNTRWIGIYKQGTSQGPVVISNNVVTNVGYDTANTISGGIYVFQSGEELVTGNYISDFKNTTAAGLGGITVYAYTAPLLPTVVSNNVVKNSLGAGILLGTYSSNVLVQDNTLLENTGADILMSGVAVATIGGHYLIGNHIVRAAGSTVPAIRESGSTSTQIVTIRRNTIIGGDNTTSNTNLNAGFYGQRASKYYVISNNTISNFYNGLYFAASQIANRYADISYNTITSCNTGINIFTFATPPSPFTVPISSNTFANNITADVGPLNSAAIGKQCLRLGTTLIVDASALPTTGSWVAGDKVFFTSSAAGASWGAVCTQTGQFGTLAGGVTASTTLGSATITVSSAANLAVTMAITIAGVTGNKIIQSISGTTVVLTTTCDATVAGAAVAYVAPTFANFAPATTYLTGSATYDPPSLTTGSGATTTVTVTGAALGDYVDGIAFSNDLQGITVTGYVSAANTVSVRFQNQTAGTIDLASGTLRVSVVRP